MTKALVGLPGVAKVSVDGKNQVTLEVDSKKFKEDDALGAMSKINFGQSTFRKEETSTGTTPGGTQAAAVTPDTLWVMEVKPRMH